ncbi:MAG TPA: dihydrodipicolinate synthase family protein [Candidatus Limnocylindrales bacterium]|nr:dihydrodipicolinate synthase family protein [Candidatus Limnocylindrales bacterium]
MTGPLTGIYNILATPFTSDLSVDFESLRRLVDFQIDKGAHGLTILAVLGEAAKLTISERAQVMETVLEVVSGRIPVIVGASHPEAAQRIAISRAAVAAGALGVMVAPPPMPGYSDEDIIALYAQIASAVDAPIVVQDFPPVNNVTMTPDMLARLAEQIPTARTLKLEDPPLMEKISAIRARTDHYAIFGGLGGMFLLEELGRGAAGTMTGFAFTEILVAVYEAWQAGDRARAGAVFDRYLPLIRYENQPIINLSIRKMLLYRRGAMATPLLRPPFTGIDAGTLDELTWVLERVGISDPTQKVEPDAVEG